MLEKKDRGFTLIELLVVIIIIGILAGIALPQFNKTKERALGNEAKANLKLIAAAEKIYRMEQGTYYPLGAGTQSDINEINSNLKLSLTETNWDYVIITFPSWPVPDLFTAYAARWISGSYTGCYYSIDQGPEDPVPHDCP